jgi:hypothetical protein
MHHPSGVLVLWAKPGAALGTLANPANVCYWYETNEGKGHE